MKTEGALHERRAPTKCLRSASIEPKQHYRKASVSEESHHAHNRESSPARDGSAATRKLISRRKSALR